MTEEKRIPRAWSVRWRRLRCQMVPIAMFVAVVVFCGWLWERRGGAVQGVGEVDMLRVNVTSPATGLVEAFPGEGQIWKPFDRVEAGDVLGRLRVTSAGPRNSSTESGAVESNALLDIHAPVSGTLIDLNCWPGQTVAVGGLVATIAADHSRHIVSYFPENKRMLLEAGMLVAVRPRGVGTRRMETQIEQVGQQMRQVPAHQNLNPSMPQWGVPVRIRLPEESDFLPGSLVDVFFP